MVPTERLKLLRTSLAAAPRGQSPRLRDTLLSAGEVDVSGQRVMLVASGGGHWTQLLRLRSAFSGADLSYISTIESCKDFVPESRFYLVNDANIRTKVRLATMAARVGLAVLREQPHLVVSTGAAPGYFALRFAKAVGARTIWIDSMANAENLSLAGQNVRPYADLWLTQWPHLASASGPQFAGSVL